MKSPIKKNTSVWKTNFGKKIYKMRIPKKDREGKKKTNELYSLITLIHSIPIMTRHILPCMITILCLKNFRPTQDTKGFCSTYARPTYVRVSQGLALVRAFESKWLYPRSF